MPGQSTAFGDPWASENGKIENRKSKKSKHKKNSFSENSQTVKIDLKCTFLGQI